jgi:hypothetical protein
MCETTQADPDALFPNYVRGSRDVHKALHIVGHRITLRAALVMESLRVACLHLFDGHPGE